MPAVLLGQGRRAELIPLDQQDRTLWDKEEIAEGIALISKALPKGSVGPYQLQAAIAALHDEATNVENRLAADPCPL